MGSHKVGRALPTTVSPRVEPYVAPTPSSTTSTPPGTAASSFTPAPATAASAGSQKGPILPEAGKLYAVDARFGGQQVPLSVTFDPALVAVLAQSSMRVDLATAELVRSNGERIDLTFSRDRYRKEKGADPPPWTFYDSTMNLFGVPKGVLTVSHEPSGVRLNYDAMEYGFRFFRTSELPVIKGARDFEPLPPTAISARLDIGDQVFITASTPELTKMAKTLFDAVIGKSAPIRDQLTITRRDVIAARQSLEAEKDSASPRSQELIATLKKLSAPDDASTWTREDALAAADAMVARLGQALLPVEISVVPKGKHFTAMPQLAIYGDQVHTLRSSEAANILGERRIVYVLEEELTSGAVETTSRHELYHLLEGQYLAPSIVAKIDRIHAQTLQNGGPFARQYGVQRSEFVTTMAELFEGGWGHEGQVWLRDNQRELYEIFSDVTGRRPA